MTHQAKAYRAPPSLPQPKRRQYNRMKICGRQRIWAAMAVLGKFDLPALLMTAQVKRAAAMDYLLCLKRIGYVEQLATRGGHPCFKLVKKTGPIHPRLWRRRMPDGASTINIYDENEDRAFTLPVAPKSRADKRVRAAPAEASNIFEGGVVNHVCYP